jgi:DNA-binding Xre family transcriptional regulator
MQLIEAVRIRLDAVLEEKGVNPYKVHKEGGIAKSTLSQVMHGKQTKVVLNTLYDITSTLGISLKEFFDDPIFDEVTD